VDGPAAPTSSPTEGIRPFVGRQRELELITSALDEARARRGRLLVLTGEPGIGKTRLADETAGPGHIGATLGFVPQFFLEFPESSLPGTWDEMKGLQLNPNTALPPKVKELIGLAVASQIPCAGILGVLVFRAAILPRCFAAPWSPCRSCRWPPRSPVATPPRKR
jgi:alkylhydroperoxidase/carboxymuconolactone decarboxylase family protein YurZ